MKIGKIGESFFEKYYFPTIKRSDETKIIDVRKTRLERENDIDYIVVPKDMIVDDVNNLEWQNFIKDELMSHTEKKLKKSKIFAIEVKTDTKALKTGNVPYDITSHDKPGGLGRSLADFIFFAAIDENQNVRKYSMINSFKLRRVIGENCEKINKIPGLFMKYFKDGENKKDGNSLLLLTSFEFLEKNKIAKVYDFTT